MNHAVIHDVVYDRRSEVSPEISFLVPVYNERPRIASVLDRLEELPFSMEVVLVDDGSTDGTRDLLKTNERNGFLLAFHHGNRGKGSAIRTALAFARGKYVAIQDADLEYDPAEYGNLLTTLKSKNLKVVFGSRFLMENPALYFRYYWGNKIITRLINLFCGSHYTDTYTCFKLMETETLRNMGLTSKGFELEAEISAKVALRRLPYGECAIHYNPRRLEEGKKIRWHDAVKGAGTALRLRFKEGFKEAAEPM